MSDDADVQARLLHILPPIPPNPRPIRAELAQEIAQLQPEGWSFFNNVGTSSRLRL